jgi:succinyl-CoA synthetase alpha subunit
MSILVNEDTRLLVHGIASREGAVYTERMLACDTHIVAGVTAGEGGTWAAGVPVFDTVREAVRATDANASLVCVSASEAMDAILESADAELPLIVCATASVPVQDMVQIRSYLRYVAGAALPSPLASQGRAYEQPRQAILIGPASPGVFSPGKCMVGAAPEGIFAPGSVGVLSRSGSLAYEATWLLTQAGLGQSTVLGIGDGLIVGAGFVDILAMFEDDPLTEQVVLIGEIGGYGEEIAASFVADRMTKPVVAFVVGHTAPAGRPMGHQGAIIEGYSGTAQAKIEALERAGARIAHTLDESIQLLKRG